MHRRSWRTIERRLRVRPIRDTTIQVRTVLMTEASAGASRALPVLATEKWQQGS